MTTEIKKINGDNWRPGMPKTGYLGAMVCGNMDGNIRNVLKPKPKRMLLLKRNAQNNGRVYGESRNFSE